MIEKIRRIRQFVKRHYGWVYLGSVVAAYTLIVYLSYRPETF
ncbi:hypothetical protein PP935_gp217 [Rhizobium phage RHph_N34]|uniref:Uncharacterized protein n=1 Tax=Rhizobium phage RHph_N34 TaxID=2509586 RepID=A0A7S5RAA1_9CAUD|nr:hypothetical protein PP935_gp217 [Rhizobium phage RHph_N34]QIG73992.1 hypothetical protein EVC06_217 [Rhizobium phage RHph_N34]